ncbi:hypothetical protein ACOMHN_023698 [Nucella lapillus]
MGYTRHQDTDQTGSLQGTPLFSQCLWHDKTSPGTSNEADIDLNSLVFKVGFGASERVDYVQRYRCQVSDRWDQLRASRQSLSPFPGLLI